LSVTTQRQKGTSNISNAAIPNVTPFLRKVAIFETILGSTRVSNLSNAFHATNNSHRKEISEDTSRKYTKA